MTYYVIHEKSETTIRDKRIFDIFKIVEIIVKNLKEVDYPKEPIISLIVMILTDYTIQQRYIKDKKDRDTFINKAFKYLHKLDPKWRKCNYLKRFNYLKRIVKTNRTLTKLYCNLYNFRHN